MKTYLNPKDRVTIQHEESPKMSPTPMSERYTVKELKQMCKDKGLTGYSKLKEAELINLLGL